jgi:hypothetical protein
MTKSYTLFFMTKFAIYILIMLLINCLFFACEYSPKNVVTSSYFNQQFNKPLHITKHAKERMQCRLIDSTEIREIINQYNINYKKSDTAQVACKQKYAFEGISHDNQTLRIIIAPCNNKLHIVTVIDLDSNKNCD